MTTQADANSQYPLTDIDAPHAHDVLCGRGGGTNNHIGNNHWRMLVAANKRLYISLPKRQKMLLSRSIVNAIRSQSPPGRFLLKDPRTSKWNDVGDQQAQQKTSQALREGAPDIRRKVDEDEEADEVQTHSESPNEPPPSASPSGDDAADPAKDTSTTTTTLSAAASGGSQAKAAEEQGATASLKKERPADDDSSNANTSNSNTNNASTPVNPSPGPTSQSMPASMPPQGSMQGMPMNGGMQHPYYMPASQQGTPMWGNQMQPHMQMYQTMVMNEHGVMVPGFAVIPTPVHPMMGQMQYPPMNHNNNNNMHQQQQQQHHNIHGSMGGAHHNNNHYPMNNNNHNQNMDHHQAMQNNNNNNSHGNSNNTPTFDEFVAAPPDALEGGVGMSFGSVTMTDAEMMRLQATGTSFGSVMSYRNSGGDHVPFPNMDAAMMSIGSNRLEQGGTSFGTMMSYNTMPEGNLEAVGTSFGSLSLEPISRDNSFPPPPPPPANGPEIHPMFDKATGNLLECSDTESEAEESNHQITSQKSAELSKMYESVALKQSKSRGTVGSNELMPPPTGGVRRSETSESHGEPLDMNGTVLSVPTTGFQRDFSNVSAWGDDDLDQEGSVLPPQLTKQGSDNDEELAGYLSVKNQSSV